MNKKEARRLALVTIRDEIEGSLNVSDEWNRHPETDEEYTEEDEEKVRAEAVAIYEALDNRAFRLLPKRHR